MIKQNKMRVALTTIFSFLLSFGFAQQQLRPCSREIVVDMDTAVPDRGLAVEKNTLKKRLELVFEQKFDDTVAVLINSKLILKKRVMTDKFLGVSQKSFFVDYASYKKRPRISVLIIHKNDCVSFFPVTGKRIAYINRSEEGWSVELSNTIREYR